MFPQGCKPGADYSQGDLVAAEETLWHHRIDPNFPANWIACFLAAAQAEGVSSCPGAGGVSQQLEEVVEVSTLT